MKYGMERSLVNFVTEATFELTTKVFTESSVFYFTISVSRINKGLQELNALYILGCDCLLHVCKWFNFRIATVYICLYQVFFLEYHCAESLRELPNRVRLIICFFVIICNAAAVIVWIKIIRLFNYRLLEQTTYTIKWMMMIFST